MTNEIWKDIPGYEGLYQVSDMGGIKSLDKTNFRGQFYHGRKLKYSTDKDGYHKVCLFKDGIRKYIGVHRLILMTFIGVPSNNLICCHNNGIRDDNRLENLRWGTAQNNSDDMVLHGTIRNGDKINTNKLKDAEVWMIKKLLSYGVKVSKIAKMFKITIYNIYKINNGSIWKHIRLEYEE